MNHCDWYRHTCGQLHFEETVIIEACLGRKSGSGVLSSQRREVVGVLGVLLVLCIVHNHADDVTLPLRSLCDLKHQRVRHYSARVPYTSYTLAGSS